MILVRLKHKKKYGSIDGVYQEKEGPAVAKEILKKVGYNKNIDRICFIIGNHHTPSKIDGLDFQIQWEADLLENLTVMDKEKEQEKIKKCIDENFKTNTGKRIACSACHSYCGAACRRIG